MKYSRRVFFFFSFELFAHFQANFVFFFVEYKIIIC